MMRAVLLCLVASATAVEQSIFDYTKKSYRVGEWSPPDPPMHESSGLKGKVPIPMSSTFDQQAGQFKFSEMPMASAFQAGSRKLLMAGGEATKGSKVPHNWFGQGKYVAPIYDVATGKEECDVCQLMIDAGRVGVEVMAGGEVAIKAAAEAAKLGKKALCSNVDPKFKDMCNGYDKYLQDCPSFVHNICHQDMGGSERLRSPCPEYLICYYCLRINPLYCFDDD